MFWKKKTDTSEAWIKLMQLLEIMKVEITTLKTDVEMLNAKFRSKVFKEAKADEELDDLVEKKKDPLAIDDGFNRLRDIA